MKNIVQLIAEIITTGIKEHYKDLVNGHQDISQFILSSLRLKTIWMKLEG